MRSPLSDSFSCLLGDTNQWAGGFKLIPEGLRTAGTGGGKKSKNTNTRMQNKFQFL